MKFTKPNLFIYSTTTQCFMICNYQSSTELSGSDKKERVTVCSLFGTEDPLTNSALQDLTLV